MALRDQIIGNAKICDVLEKSLREGRLSHAYLFDGPEHIGKYTLAMNFSRLMLSQPAGNIESNPDFLLVRPAEDKKQIVIDQIRELEKNVSLSPYQSEYKMAIIDQAEKMTEEASNALLKTLEEPSKTTILILITSNSKRILETIKSRCQILRFLPIKKEELVARFKKDIDDEKELDGVIEVSGYKPGRIIEMIENMDTRKELMGEMEYFGCISKLGDVERLEKAEAISSYEETKLIGLLDLWTFCIRKDMTQDLMDGKPMENKKTARILKRANLIKKTREDILTKNINMKLALENLILEL